MKKYTDKEIISEIKKGNKDALVYLYNSNYNQAKKYVLKHGGSESDAGSLLKAALLRLWSEVQESGSPIEDIDLPGIMREKLDLAWMSGELTRYIERNTSVKPYYVKHFNRKTALFIILFIIIVSIPVLWIYVDNNFPPDQNIFPLNKLNTLHSDTLSKVEETKSKTSKTSKKEKQNETEAVDSTEIVESQDSLNHSVAYQANESSNSSGQEPEAPSPAPNGEDQYQDIVIKKDRLVFIKMISIIEKPLADQGKEKGSASTREILEKLNPDGKLPDEAKFPKSILVECWKSPVNYKGYKLTRNKIALFGIDEPDLIRLYNIEDNMYLEYGQNFYSLEVSYDFRSFTKLKDPVIIAQLTKP